MSDCIFCKIVSGELPSHKIYEDDKHLAFLNIRPITRGHALVIPKEHHARFSETPEEVVSSSYAVARRIVARIMAAVGAADCNVDVNDGPVAGQVVGHLHIHIIPRFVDDGLTSWTHGEVSAEELEQLASKIVG